ncbi:MAG: cytochrome c [Bryobacteraceae bacterium]|nr:cytochrome c [Bryobacteraceae bacterium]
MRARLLALVLCWAPLAGAHEVITTKITWTREIVRIFEQRCFACHTEGSTKAPFSLRTYDEARPWARAISEEVLERRMPPSNAAPGFGPHFSNNPALSQEEINLIAEWVEGGAPEGDPKYLPPPPPAPLPAPLSATLPRGSRLTIRTTTFTTRSSLSLTALEVAPLPKDSSLLAIAELPDGSLEPLLWIRRYDPRAPRFFVLTEPLALPAGTKVTLSGAPNLTLITQAPSPGHRTAP